MSYYYQHSSVFASRTVEEFDPQRGVTTAVGTAIALRYQYDGSHDVPESLALLVQDPLAVKLEALVIGTWKDLIEGGDNSSEVVNALVAVADRLPNLKAIFLGDILSEEYEISWISQSDISPILSAYPNLEWLQVRGGSGLQFSPVYHDNLKYLIIETGGLSREAIAQICQLQLPNLEHLELWLGSDYYGGDSTVEDLQPILEGNLYPKLKYLGLRNAQYTDEIAEAVGRSRIINQLKTLDLSMGTLGAEGAEFLFSCAAIKTLDTLNVAENYLNDEDIAKLASLKINLIAADQKDIEEYDDEDERYCSVSE
jgi:hypothetical protein